MHKQTHTHTCARSLTVPLAPHPPHPQVYFRLNTVTNCKNVISTIDNVLKNFDTAEAAYRVTYR